MKLKDILNYIDECKEFELHKGDRIGVFQVTDIGLDEYLEYEITMLSIDNQRLIICLKY